jgi:phage shock protein A
MAPVSNENKNSKNGWEENARLVLAELQRLNDNYEELNSSVRGLTDEVTKVKAVWHVVDEIKDWKTNMSEVASATQLKEALEKIARLETFKTVSTTIWAVIQTIVIAYLTYKSSF